MRQWDAGCADKVLSLSGVIDLTLLSKQHIDGGCHHSGIACSSNTVCLASRTAAGQMYSVYSKDSAVGHFNPDIERHYTGGG